MGKSSGVYLSDERYEQVQAKADANFRGKVSAYIGDLIDRDLDGSNNTPDATDQDLIKKLFSQYLPIRTEQAEEALKNWPNLKQKKLVHDLFEALLDYLEDYYEHPGKVALMPDTSAAHAKDLLRVAEEQGEYGAEAAKAKKILNAAAARSTPSTPSADQAPA